MSKKTYIFMKGLPAPVDLTSCPEVLEALPKILTFLPYEIRDELLNDVKPFFTVRPFKTGYLVGSSYSDGPKSYPDPVNTLCALVAELAWEQLRVDSTLLCVHAAAVEINGRLLLIPNKRRAGKSTLVAALAARGYRVFTDDYLPLGVNGQNQLCGIASGIAPRLRLPLPDGFGADHLEFVNRYAGPSNKQYQYLQLDDRALASKGEMLPIGGIMVLDRDDDNRTEMAKAEPAEVLRVLITQNFAREMKSSGILRNLEFLVRNASCHELRYSEVGQTLDLIEQSFSNWQLPIVTFDINENSGDFQTADLDASVGNVVNFTSNDPLQQAPGVTIRDMGDKKFLSDQNGLAIHQLNETSAAIWQLLDEPTSLSELTEIFHHAFPDNNANAMCEDIRKTLQGMSKAGLVRTMTGGAYGT